MLRKFVKEQYYCGLDLGPQSIKVGLIKDAGSHSPILLGVGESRTSGFHQASVSDLAELADCIQQTMAGLTRKTGIKPRDVYLGITADVVEKRFSHAVLPLVDRGSKVITLHDVKKVCHQARLLGVNMEEAILHDLPQYYKVDDVNTAMNPIGLYGRKLEINTLLIVLNHTLLKNIIKAVNQAGYDVAHLFLTSLAGAEGVLDDYQKRQGCMVADIGGRSTNFLIFKDGQLRYLDKIPLGGEHITQRIADGLSLGLDLADEIKKSYATALVPESQNEEEILIRREDQYLPIKKGMITAAIDPIVTELVDSLSQRIQQAGFSHQINAGLFVVGGGALLPGLPERIEQKINLPVKVGQVRKIDKRLTNGAKFASVIGLAQAGLLKIYDQPVSSNGHPPGLSRLFNKVREIYQEYF